MENFLCPRRVESGVRPDGPFKTPETDHWREDNTCSWCGSLDPAKFLELAKTEELVPTDKNYKVYIRPGQQKFYFQHFSDEQKKAFVELLNAKTMKFAYPHRFYVLPYFVRTE